MSENVCPHCGGSGWRIREQDGISGAERCGCVAAERSADLVSRAGIPPLYANASFDNFKLPQDNPGANRALAQVMRDLKSFVREYPLAPKKGLLLIGPAGIGKTHLAVAVLRALLERGFEGTFFAYQNLLEKIRAGYDPASGASDREAYRTALETEVLLLDDLGAHRVLEWIEDTVTSIMTHRCNRRMALIATTNLLDPDAGDPPLGRGEEGQVMSKFYLAERIGTRARSRLFEMCRVIRMPNVEDYRVRKEREKSYP